MPIPANYIKIVWAGALPSGERWSTSVGVNGEVAKDAIELTNLLGDLDGACAAGGGFYGGLAALNPPAVTMDTMQAYQYQNGAKATTQAEITPSYTPGTQTVRLPNQVCLVASLRTGRPGRSFRGRMYLPVQGAGLNAEGLINPGTQTNLANGLATSFGTFNSSGDGKIVVMSAVLGVMTQVTDVVINNVPDTQRRRTDKITGAQTSSAAVAL